jgi:hypothetical protein
MNNLIRCSVSTVFCALVALAFAPAAFAQVKIQSQPALDVTFSVSSLGWGVQAARPLPHRSDVRGGFNFYTYNTTITEDGADYTTDVRLRSVNVQFDKYLLAGFFASGGALVWNGNNGDAKVSVPGGQSFSLGNVTYFSDAANPVHGDSTVTVQKFAPLLSLGYGNLTSRGHFAYTVEAGVAFHGTPHATLSLAGSACKNFPPAPTFGGGFVCQDIATNPGIQNDVAAQQQKVNDDISNFKYYPILQFSIGYKF